MNGLTANSDDVVKEPDYRSLAVELAHLLDVCSDRASTRDSIDGMEEQINTALAHARELGVLEE